MTVHRPFAARRHRGRMVLCLLLLTSRLAAGEGGASVPSDVPNPVDQNMKFMQDLFGQAMSSGGGSQQAGQVSLKTVQRLLAKERDLKIWESRGRIFIEGRVTSEQMKTRIDKLLSTFANLIDLTEYQPDMDTFLADMDLIKEKIEETLNKGYDKKAAFSRKQTVTVNIINDKIVVSGELNTQDDVDKALHIASIFNDSVVSNLSVSKQMIEVAAIFAKLNRNNGNVCGAEGLTSAIVTFPVVTTSPIGDATPQSNPFDYFRFFQYTASSGTFTLAPNADSASSLSIDFLKTFTKSAILARPHLATINGQAAEFLAGGEKAIKTFTSTVSDVEYKSYGVILSTTPSLTTEGRIKLNIKLEFSVPEANGEDFVTFRHDGQAILSRNQGVVMSGLINEARSQGFSRTPFVGNVPILKVFFSKDKAQKSLEDLVLLVIPRVPSVVDKAPFPKVEQTSTTAEDAYWIHKPHLADRLGDCIRGHDPNRWREPGEVEITTPEILIERSEPDGEEAQAQATAVSSPDAAEPGQAAAADGPRTPDAPDE